MEQRVLNYQNAINSKAGRLGPTGGLGVWDTAVLINGSPSALSAQPLAYVGAGCPSGRASYVTAGNPGLQGTPMGFSGLHWDFRRLQHTSEDLTSGTGSIHTCAEDQYRRQLQLK